MAEKSLQETHGPKNTCFGCGPSNMKGLRIKSFVRGDQVTCDWQPEPHHEAFPNVLCGGIIGTLLDCHSNWTAAWHLKEKRQVEKLPYTVTAEYSVKLLDPTPTSGPVHLVAKVVESSLRRAIVDAALSAGGKVTATCHGIFVAVEAGHPAYGRW